ncbi:hypothetical protein MTO96_029278 [Rhipicephalus appendiculatus]
MAPAKVTDIVYAPKSDYNEKLMDAVAEEIYRLVTSKSESPPLLVTFGGMFLGPQIKQSRSHLYGAQEGILDVDTLLAVDSDKKPKGPDIFVITYKKAKLVPVEDSDAVVQECKSLLNKTKTFGDRREPLCLTLNKTSESAGFVLRLFAPVSLLKDDMDDFHLGSSKADDAFGKCLAPLVIQAYD